MLQVSLIEDLLKDSYITANRNEVIFNHERLLGGGAVPSRRPPGDVAPTLSRLTSFPVLVRGFFLRVASKKFVVINGNAVGGGKQHAHTEEIDLSEQEVADAMGDATRELMRHTEKAAGSSLETLGEPIVDHPIPKSSWKNFDSFIFVTETGLTRDGSKIASVASSSKFSQCVSEVTLHRGTFLICNVDTGASSLPRPKDSSSGMSSGGTPSRTASSAAMRLSPLARTGVDVRVVILSPTETAFLRTLLQRDAERRREIAKQSHYFHTRGGTGGARRAEDEEDGEADRIRHSKSPIAQLFACCLVPVTSSNTGQRDKQRVSFSPPNAIGASIPTTTSSSSSSPAVVVPPYIPPLHAQLIECTIREMRKFTKEVDSLTTPADVSPEGWRVIGR